ncbi:MAG: histidinol dehydrogenase, partial [Mucilaginibacter sp.]
MKRYNYSDLSKADIQKLVQRNVDPADEIREAVEAIIKNVRTDDDDALIAYAYKFDKVVLMRLAIEKDELAD